MSFTSGLLQNVLANILTLALLPVGVTAFCLGIGTVFHALLGDVPDWWEATLDYWRCTRASRSRDQTFLQTVIFWIRLPRVLILGTLGDPTILDESNNRLHRGH